MAKSRQTDPVYLDPDVTIKEDSKCKYQRRHPSPLPWYGSKARHLSWLLPLLPKCRHYVEPFGGSAVVLLNREPSPIETYNDINGDVVNFFKVLRDSPDELINAVQLTPLSREEFALALYADDNPSKLERARRFCVICQQSFMSIGTKASLSFWTSCINRSSQGISASIARMQSKHKALAYTASRLLNVQIENRPALECILKYDSPDTFFYCDPPYTHDTRVSTKRYADEMTDNDHLQLAALLNNIQGKVALSGYDCDLYNDIFTAPKWFKYQDEERITAASTTKTTRQEILWMNYSPDALTKNQLF